MRPLGQMVRVGSALPGCIQRKNDAGAIAFVDSREAAQDDHQSSVGGPDRFDTPAEQVADRTQNVTLGHSLAERDDRLEEALAGRRMMDLHVSGARAWILDD